MRVLFVTPVGTLGGAERRWSISALAETGGAVPVAGPAGGGRRAVAGAGAAALGVEARVEPMPAGLAALGDSGLRGHPARAAARLLRASAGRAFHLGARPLGLARPSRALPDRRRTPTATRTTCSAVLGLGGAPLVWHCTTSSPSGRMIPSAPGPRLRASAAVAISRRWAATASGARAACPSHVVSTRWTRGTSCPGPATASAWTRWPAFRPRPEATLRVGLVATFARWKGQGVFLEASATCWTRAPPRRCASTSWEARCTSPPARSSRAAN